MQGKNLDDLDFNIEEVEQVIAPQIDTGAGDIGDSGDIGDGTDDSDKGDEDPSKAGNFSKSRKIFCC